MVKIRLKRLGYKKNPIYRIVVINSREKREGKPIAELGYYNPKCKELKLNKQAALEWITKGAQPTETVDYLIKNSDDNGALVRKEVTEKKLSKKAAVKQETAKKEAAKPVEAPKAEVKTEEAKPEVKAEEETKEEAKAPETEVKAETEEVKTEEAKEETQEEAAEAKA